MSLVGEFDEASEISSDGRDVIDDVDHVAHELNNILAVIQGHLEFLGAELVSQPAAQRVATMAAAVQRGSALVECLRVSRRDSTAAPLPASTGRGPDADHQSV